VTSEHSRLAQPAVAAGYSCIEKGTAEKGVQGLRMAHCSAAIQYCMPSFQPDSKCAVNIPRRCVVRAVHGWCLLASLERCMAPAGGLHATY
jgi:hypothetical protein